MINAKVLIYCLEITSVISCVGVCEGVKFEFAPLGAFALVQFWVSESDRIFEIMCRYVSFSP